MTGVPDEQWTSPTPLPGWCVHDVVAHVIGTESMLSGVATPQLDVDVTTFGHVRNPIGELNECWVQHLSGETGRRRADAVPRRHRRAQSSAHRHDRRRLERDHDDARRAGHLRPVHAHPDLRLLDAPAGHPGGLVASAVRRRSRQPGVTPCARRDGRQHGVRRRQARQGARRRAGGVRADRAAGAHHQGGGRRPGLPWSTSSRAAPTTVIRLDGLQFTRLCGGRPLGDDRPRDVEFEGDAEVGQRIVDNMAYVI